MSSEKTPCNTSTPKTSTGSPSSQDASSLSSTSLSIHRLETYIDNVRQLESENKRLKLKCHTTQNATDREVTSVRNSYEKELADTRQLLDGCAREKTALQLEAGRMKTELGELNLKLNKAKADLTASEKKLNQVKVNLNRANDEKKETAAKMEKLSKQVSELQEQLVLKHNMFEKEGAEMKQQYQADLQSSMQEVRKNYEEQMKKNREEVVEEYQDEIDELEQQAHQLRCQNSTYHEELLQARIKIDSYNSKVSELESVNAQLKNCNAQLDHEREAHAATKQENEHMRKQRVIQLQEYQKLVDIRTALETEMSAYRKLIAAEETRLNLTPRMMDASGSSSASQNGTPSLCTPTHAFKRKRRSELSFSPPSDFETIANAKGDVEIVEVDPGGKFIRLNNKGNKEISLSGWKIVQNVNEKVITCTFKIVFNLAPGASVSIWSSDSGVEQELPSTVVMGEQHWFVDSEVITKLINENGEEMAENKRTLRQ